jgi:hypothetical protein
LVPLTKLSDFPQRTFDAPKQSFLFGYGETQFVLMALLNLGDTLRKFRFEARPPVLVLTVVFTLKQPECFLGGKLSDAGEIFHSKALQNLGAGQFAFARTERAFDYLGRYGSRRHSSSS